WEVQSARHTPILLLCYRRIRCIIFWHNEKCVEYPLCRDCGVESDSRDPPAANRVPQGMRKISLSGLAVLSTLTPVFAASPLGNWLVEEKTAQVRIVDCNSVLWGVFSWEKEPGMDTSNPDPLMKGKPLLGSPLLRGLKSTKPGEWQGKVYNPE